VNQMLHNNCNNVQSVAVWSWKHGEAWFELAYIYTLLIINCKIWNAIVFIIILLKAMLNGKNGMVDISVHNTPALTLVVSAVSET